MTLAVRSHPPASVDERSSRSHPVLLLQVFALAVMVFPSDTVFKPVGAAGYPASLIGVFIFGAFCVAVLFSLHRPGRYSHPIRGVLAVIWIAVLASYIAMNRGKLDGLQIASADRQLIRFAVVTGIALVAAEWLRTVDEAMRVVRVLCWGAAFCGLVAVLQYWISLDLAHYLRQIPGFTVNQDNPAITARGSLNRVAGTATTSIELGVVMGMLIPIGVCLGLYDRDKPTFKRWGPLAMIVFGVATSVSRSAVVSVVVAFSVLLALLPARQRLAALAGLPIALGGIFMSAHGLIGVLASFFASAKNDPSVQYRTHDYPVAEHLWQASPFFGQGPGTYMPTDSLNIFDNQWLNSAVELGTVGIVALVVFLFVPGIVAIYARRWTMDPQLRLLLGALAAAAFVGPLCSATFDSFSFPMFVNVYSLVIGLIGFCWRLAAAEGAPRRMLRRAALAPMQLQVPQPAAFSPRRADP
jgi:hypothetical protein